MAVAHAADSYGLEVATERAPGRAGRASLDELVADGTQVARRLAALPAQRVVRIPARAVDLVADLDRYGD